MIIRELYFQSGGQWGLPYGRQIFLNYFCVETVEVIHHRHHLGRLCRFTKDKSVPNTHRIKQENKKGIVRFDEEIRMKHVKT